MQTNKTKGILVFIVILFVFFTGFFLIGIIVVVYEGLCLFWGSFMRVHMHTYMCVCVCVRARACMCVNE